MESREKEMNVFLKISRTVSVKVNSSETIKNLKSIIHEKEGISENLQELFFSGERLKDDQKLVDYGIKMNSVVHLVLNSVKFFVNIPSYQKTFELEATPNETIQNIKSLIQAKEGIESDHYSLFYSGKLLEDNATLFSLKIQEDSTLYLVFNPRDELSVSVKMPTGKILKAEVKLLYTIGEVKAIIGSMLGISVGDRNLIYAGKKLEDPKTLASYDIRENFILDMLPPTFQVFVKGWNGKTVVLDVHRLETVRDVKFKIFDKLGMPVKVQSLVFAGKSLEDDRDLASYNIQKHSTLHMVSRPATLIRRMKLSDIGCPLPLPGSTTIRSLKAIMEKKLEISVKEVYYGGFVLEDHIFLADFAIKNNTPLRVALEVK